MKDDSLAALRAENEVLRGRLSALEAIFRAMPDLYFRLARDGRILEYRAGHASSLHVSPEMFLGKTMQEVLPPHVEHVRDSKTQPAGRWVERRVGAMLSPTIHANSLNRRLPVRSICTPTYIRRISNVR